MTGGAVAQESDEQKRLKEKHEKKAAAKFVSFGKWVLDYDQARARASAEGKLIFAYFTRSYAR